MSFWLYPANVVAVNPGKRSSQARQTRRETLIAYLIKRSLNACPFLSTYGAFAGVASLRRCTPSSLLPPPRRLPTHTLSDPPLTCHPPFPVRVRRLFPFIGLSAFSRSAFFPMRWVYLWFRARCRLAPSFPTTTAGRTASPPPGTAKPSRAQSTTSDPSAALLTDGLARHGRSVPLGCFVETGRKSLTVSALGR